MAPKQECVGLYSPGSYCVQRDENGIVDPLRTQQVMEDRTAGLMEARGGGEWRRINRDNPPPQTEAYRHDEENWVVPYCNALYRALGLPRLSSKNGQKYADFVGRIILATLYIKRVKAGIEAGKLLEPPQAEWALQDFVYFREVKDNKGRIRPALFMRGMPSPRAFKTFMGLPLGWLDAYEKLVAPILVRLVRDIPGLIVQWELPAELAFGSLPFASHHQQQQQFVKLMQLFERLISLTPAGTKHAWHLCWGDLRRRPFVPFWLQMYRTLVACINAILAMKVWKHNGGDHELFAIHVPHADGRRKAKFSWRVRRAFRKMQAFPKGTVYAIGALWPEQRLPLEKAVDEVVSYTKQFLDVVGDKVSLYALSTNCGDGRLEDNLAKKQWEIGVAAARQLMDA